MIGQLFKKIFLANHGQFGVFGVDDLALLLGAGALGAGAGGLFYGASDKRKPDLNIPIREEPYTSLTEFPTGSELNKQILAGMQAGTAGQRGIGLGPDYQQLLTQQGQMDIQDAIKAATQQAAGAGLGRSASLAGQVGDITRRGNLATQQNIQDLQIQDELRKQQLFQDFLSRGMSYSQAEAATRQAAANFDLQRGLAQKGLESNERTRQQQNVAGAFGVGTGVAALPFQASLDDLLAEQQRRQNETSTAGYGTSPSPYSELTQGGQPTSSGLGASAFNQVFYNPTQYLRPMAIKSTDMGGF